MGPDDVRLALGLACALSWNLMAVLGGGVGLLSAYGAGLVAALVALAACGLGRVRLPASLPALLGAAVAMTCGVAPMLGLVDGVLASVLGALCGAGSAYVFFRWFEAYAALDARRALCLFLCALGASCVLRLGLSALLAAAPLACGLLLLGCIVASTAALARSGRAPARPTSPAREPIVAPPPFGFGGVLAELAAFGLIFGALEPDALSGAVGVTRVGLVTQAALCLGLLAWFCSELPRRVSGSAVRRGLVAAAILLVAVAAFWEPDPRVLAVAAMALRVLVLVLMYVRLYAAHERDGLACAVVFGSGRAVFGVAGLAGRALRGLVVSRASVAALPPSVAGFAVACVSLLLLNSLLRRTLAEPVADTAEPGLDARLDALADACGISPREGQVMRLLCAGASTKEIATRLGISENTVLTHTRQVYRKAGVHGKQELLMRALELDPRDVG